MKKNFAFLVLLLFFIQPSRAQYAPFFNDDFDSNTNNWFVGEIKKSTVQFYNGRYCVYNDWGKNPIISLIDLPFNEQKNYKIESGMEPGYIPREDGGAYGIMFAAKDEKNGYAVFLNRWGHFRFVKIENGKITEIKSGVSDKIHSYQDANKENSFTILLEDLRWKITVNDAIIYSGSRMSWMGHKVGFYASDEGGYSASNLKILEATPGPSPCPLPFKQEQLNETLNKLICAAPDDFATVLGAFDYKTTTMEVWKTKDVSLNGSKQIFLASNIPPNKKSKDFIIMFSCSDLNNAEFAELFFDQFMKAINEVKPTCGILKQRDVEHNLADFLVKSVIWDIEVKTPSSGTVHVNVELDNNKFESGYYNTLHVNVPE